MLLRDIYEQNHYAFVKTPMTWEESIRECCKPLEAAGTVNPEYADDIIECVKKYGPYIVIVPNVAMLLVLCILMFLLILRMAMKRSRLRPSLL